MEGPVEPGDPSRAPASLGGLGVPVVAVIGLAVLAGSSRRTGTGRRPRRSDAAPRADRRRTGVRAGGALPTRLRGDDPVRVRGERSGEPSGS